MGFNFRFPTDIRFGAGSTDQLPSVVLSYGQHAAIVVGEGSARSSGVLESIESSFGKNDVTYNLVEGIPTNPPVEQVESLASDLRQDMPDVIVSLGGGSVHDTAKVLALLVTHPGQALEYAVDGELGVPAIGESVKPVVTVPTIFGTGAEISPAALIRGDGMKRVIFSPWLYPRVSLVDPSLSLGAPRDVSLRVGIDGFVQGLEAYWAKNANRLSDLFARAAIRHSVSGLVSVSTAPAELDGRSELAFGSLLSLLAVANSGVGAIHAISNPLSGRLNIHHGQALAMLLVHVAEKIIPARREKSEDVQKILCDILELAMNDMGGLREVLSLLLETVDLDTAPKLSSLGVGTSELAEIAEESFNPDMATNPSELSRDDVIAILERLL